MSFLLLSLIPAVVRLQIILFFQSYITVLYLLIYLISCLQPDYFVSPFGSISDPVYLG